MALEAGTPQASSALEARAGEGPSGPTVPAVSQPFVTEAGAGNYLVTEAADRLILEEAA